MPFELRWKGDLAENVKKLQRKYSSRLEEGCRKAANILHRNVEIPYETGALGASGGVRQIGYGLKAEFIVGYGRRDFLALGFGLDRARRPPYYYAVYVHQMYVPFLSNSIQVSWIQMQEVIEKQMV